MPLVLKKYRTDEYVTQPWKNGVGLTRELAKDPVEPYRWRLSQAHVATSSPFSQFPKYDRVLLTLGHQTIWLLHGGGKKRVLPSLTPYTFSGDLETQAEIQEPVDDFNLFCLRGTAEGKIYPTYFRVSREMQLPIAGQEHFVYCVTGSLEVTDPNTQTTHALKRDELLQITRSDKKEYLNLKSQSSGSETVALWIVIHVN